jgi:phosphoribosylamine--glycine ligase
VTKPIRILVVGGGGREHALCWRIRHDRPEAELFAAPGNGGTAELATNVPLKATDIEGITAWCDEHRPDLVVIGPDDPLAAGIVDALTAAGHRTFGPTAAAARIEASKAWATGVCTAAGVPVPESHVFDDPDAADAFVRERGEPIVVKADGLALGKGVIVPDDVGETIAAIDRLGRRKAVGSAGDRLLLQQKLTGPEASVFALCDGSHHQVIGVARDYKRIGEGDTGPNTGGMGAYTPLVDVDAEMLGRIERRIIAPVLAEMRRWGAPFTGFLYAGLMLTAEGPVVIEFNSRMGDPEAQVVLPLLQLDLVEAIETAIDGRLDEIEPAPPRGAATCVVLASGGYPGDYQTGKRISGVSDTGPDTLVFQAGTRRDDEGLLTSGGRVLAVTGLGSTVAEATTRAYRGADHIDFEDAVRRGDIAAGAAQGEPS